MMVKHDGIKTRRGRYSAEQLKALRTLLMPALNWYGWILTEMNTITPYDKKLKTEVSRDVINKFFPTVNEVQLDSDDEKENYGDGIIKLLHNIKTRVTGAVDVPVIAQANTEPSEVHTNGTVQGEN